MMKLSNNSGLFPECLWIGEVKDVSKSPLAVGVFGDIWTGNIAGRRVAMKVIRHRIDSEKRQQVVKVQSMIHIHGSYCHFWSLMLIVLPRHSHEKLWSGGI